MLDLTLHRKRSLVQQIIGTGTTMTSLISVFVITGCDVYTKYHQSGAYAAAENTQAELAHEQTTFVHQYRECLAKKETNPQVDCSEYRTTIEVIEKK